MCTVTYIATKSGFVLTSNRDESKFRKTNPPKEFNRGDLRLVFPQDDVSGGTWIAFSDSGKAASLMNGAFVPHVRKLPYKRSRGQVLLEYFEYGNPEEFAASVDLEGVEPFTMVMVDTLHAPGLSVIRWDENMIHLEKFDHETHHIWSSTPLYNEKQRALREKWFEKWLLDHNKHDDYLIHQFHTSSHTQDASTDLIMKRGGVLCTVSVTQVINYGNKTKMVYEDLLTDTSSEVNIVG